MDALEHFEITDDHAIYRPVARVTFDRAVQLVAEGIAFAREQRVRNLLVDTTNLTGFDPPSLGDRYFMGREWARVAGGGVRVALVARPELIDPEKFGVLVARNSGTVGDVFTSEEEALAWLRSLP